ncbi:MAG: DNA ligase D [Gammaproteobacteria bacterium]|nr:DNA ligase D [Gammaproteobacteria bacterium]
MLASLSESIPSDGNWIYEIKFDGYRAIAFCNNAKVNLISRNNKSFNEKFYPILENLKKLKLHIILDGEIAVLKNTGITSFEKLQDWRSEADGELIYYVFDILWYEGYDMTQVPLLKRKQLLSEIIPTKGPIQRCDFFVKQAEKLLVDARKNQLEGIIAKKSSSLYHPGLRTKDWIKIKVQKRHEVVIGGFTINENTNKLFSSLLVGYYENNGLQYIGKVGTGFNNELQKNMMQQFKSLIIKKCPFTFIPDINKPSRFNPNPPPAQAIWLSPKLVCEISYAEMTRDGIIRHPSFKGMRIDKSPKDVHPEVPQKTDTQKNLIINIKAPKKGERKTLLNPKEDTQVKVINNHEIKFNHLNKIFWPKEGYTKRDLLNYYYQVAPYILPYLLDRPQTLNRFPNGIKGMSFYQKDVTKAAPSWIKQYPYRTSLGEDKNFLIVQDEADLLWMINLGVIEINPWNSTIKKPDYPTWCMIDIDPSPANSFEQVIETAKVTKKILDELNIPGYCKTSGASGLHIYIPIGIKYSYPQCQLLGRMIAAAVNKRLPKTTSIERYSIKRPNKIYIDFLQNRPKATVAAPYSVRPRPGSTVSMPLHWDEVKKGLRPTQFTLKNALQRIKSEGDLFKPVLGKGIALNKVLKNLEDCD